MSAECRRRRNQQLLSNCEVKKIKTRQRLFILTGASDCEQILASPEVQTPQRAPGPPEQLYLKPANLWLLDRGGGGLRDPDHSNRTGDTRETQKHKNTCKNLKVLTC